MFHPNQRIALFIDGANLHAASQSLEFKIDYKKLLDIFIAKGQLLRAYYYTALLKDGDSSSVKALADWLGYNGFTMITKAAKEFTDLNGQKIIKGNMDVEIAVDVMEIAPTVQHVIIFSGDGDFRSLVEAVQRKGVRVSIVSTAKSNPPMIADELRRQADHFIELFDLKEAIARHSSK